MKLDTPEHVRQAEPAEPAEASDLRAASPAAILIGVLLGSLVGAGCAILAWWTLR